MKSLKIAVVFTAIVCLTGSFQKIAKAEFYFGPGCEASCWRPNRLEPSSPGNNSQGSSNYSSLVRSLYSKASDARWAGDYATEFRIYNRIISLDSQAAQAYFNRGSIKQSKLNDKAGAMADFQIAYQLFRQRGDQYMIRASMEHINQLSE
jgi:tetratricopeptide (TPR) repeat protein